MYTCTNILITYQCNQWERTDTNLSTIYFEKCVRETEFTAENGTFCIIFQLEDLISFSQNTVVHNQCQLENVFI